jgi:predicted signal transduction protein with EAL and GGDEF domain
MPHRKKVLDLERSSPDRAKTEWLDAALDEVVLRCDHAGRVLEHVGPERLMPADGDALRGRAVTEMTTLPAPMRHAWASAFERAVHTQHPQICSYRLDRGAGPRAFEARFVPLAATSVAVAIRDVGERDQLREQVEHHALHDLVTGLGNLRSMRERLEAWMRSGGPRDLATATPVALLIIDLDRFKQSNDLYGRTIGDSLLCLVAQRIRRETLRELVGQAYEPHDVGNPNGSDERDDPSSAAALAIARLGGDQFAVAWRIAEQTAVGVSSDGDRGGYSDLRATSLAARLITAIAAPARIAGKTLIVRASIGVALFPADATTPSALYSQAEAALKRAKLAGRNQVRRHGDDREPAQSAALLPRNEATLRAALASNQFLLLYQPKFRLATSLVDRTGIVLPGEVLAVEALVRWRSPSGALLIPHEFVPLAEVSGMIVPLGDWVLRTALAEVARFATHPASQGARRVGVAINVSLVQLHDRTFVQTVEAALRESGFAAHELTVEIAETSFLEDIRLAIDALAELSSMGVRLAIDHFGVGTAGLVALKALPIDEIKIDRSFIAGAAIDAFDATIVSSLIDMAHDLGKTVTADGVERIDQVTALAQMRCDAIQGYFVGEPMSAADLVAAASLWQILPQSA